MKKILFTMSFLFSTLLVGCGGGSDTTNNDDGNTGGTNSGSSNNSGGLASIVSFDVKGTSADNADGRAPLNPAENNGKWGINWEANLKKGSGTTHLLQVIINVSEDDKLSSTDPEIYRALCTGSKCIGSTKLAMSCYHRSSSSVVDCEDDVMSGVFQYYNIEPFLDKIPKNAHFILTASGIDGQINDELKATATHPVVFE